MGLILEVQNWHIVLLIALITCLYAIANKNPEGYEKLTFVLTITFWIIGLLYLFYLGMHYETIEKTVALIKDPEVLLKVKELHYKNGVNYIVIIPLFQILMFIVGYVVKNFIKKQSATKE